MWKLESLILPPIFLVAMTILRAFVIVAIVICAANARSNSDEPLGHHGLYLESVGFGTAGLGQNTHDAVLAALNLGVRIIDSAQAYEWYNEEGVGSAVEEFVASNEGAVTADDVVIITKIHPRSYSYEEMDRKLAESKLLFKRDKLDVVLLHAPWCWPGHCTPEEEAVGWETGWRNLVALQHKHRITSLGVSNFHAELLNKLIHEMHGQVDVVQNWMDPFHQDNEVRDICMHQGVQYMAYSSFGTQWNRTPNPVLSNPLLIEIAEHHGVSVAQVVMSWLATEGAIAIPRTANEAHMRDNFAELMLHRRVQAECAAVSAQGGEVGVHCDEGHAPRSWNLDYNELRAIRALDGTLGNPWD